MIRSMRLDGSTACMAIEGATDTQVFRAYVRQVLWPTLRPGDLVQSNWPRRERRNTTGARSYSGLNGSVATLQVARDRLVGCSSWTLRFAVYSSGGNLSRRSSCWQWGGTCAFPFRTVTSRNSLLSADCWSTGRPRHRLEVGPTLRPGNSASIATDVLQLCSRGEGRGR